MKICSKCKIEKSLSEFDKHSKSKDGYKYVCKSCRKEHNRLFYINQKEIIKNRVKKYRNSNKQRIKILKETYRISHPWINTRTRIKQRCTNKNNDNYSRYGGRGIKCLITSDELKQLWFRDKACEMKQPSIDRVDNDGNYEYSNCRFIELSENSKKQHRDSKLKTKEKLK